ncbi:MAG: radical SAM protein [Candidatus Latescibacterota bacterium]|nr:radical SAM protein [Candidatus Latescibacterota bacterium]
MNPLQVYLCDLTHDDVALVIDTIPINIGNISAYAKKVHGRDINITMFKYPNSAIQAIKASPPDVIGLSNYAWNSNLSEYVAGIAKENNPHVVTVQGGVNFPHEPDNQHDFLIERPNTDIFVVLESEVAFAKLVGRVLAARDGGIGVFDAAIPGCVFLEPSTRLLADPVLIRGELPDRIKELDDIPSTYLDGSLDHFFDGRLTPFLETNRGCPFRCTFCHDGAAYFNKVTMFSIERIVDEIEYIAPRVSALGISNLHIADTNFGMYERDREISETLYKAFEKYAWPTSIMATTGKNNKERVIDITKIMGTKIQVTMSVQSMDDKVLSHIERSNIKLDHYAAINNHLQEEGRSTQSELILGLPGETKESFTKGVKDVLDSGVSRISIHSLMLLHGTKFKDKTYRDEWGIKGKYRLVPLNFGNYDGKRMFDIEETGIENKDLPFEDYLWCRGLSMVVQAIHSDRPYDNLFRYAKTMGVKTSELVIRAYEDIDQAPKEVLEIMAGFLNETEKELWDSEQEIIEHYRKDENYKRLLAGELGGNVTHKHLAGSLVYCSEAWAEYLRMICKAIASEKISDTDQLLETMKEIDAIADFEKYKLEGFLDAGADDSNVVMDSDYDILAWQNSPLTTPLSDFAVPEPIQIVFEYTESQQEVRKDLFKRYGTDLNGLSKTVTRVTTIESQFRKVREVGSNVAYEVDEEDHNTRYSMTN